MSELAIQKFLDDLLVLNYEPQLITAKTGQRFAILKGYRIELGKFQNRIVDLGLEALTDYPRRVGQSIHVKADPQLLEKQNIPQVLNIVDSPLGSEWLYWSFQLKAHPNETARELMNQINGIFKRV